ncbi:cobyrinate a,c-diamide synthase [Spiractinospora alimapuensis]|uniref:cobyrinate a,c-diamide synthase n=1 Tax=Spiractinospora alimapuensis TaxID=2820884 RepID=UPI001EEBE901|nr:cobyrinate a,c-diamide synthase [Spiractinospora alimapuensis]QVQ55133.1 cobyrinate a,c-diamide synthase [Spiractinospora alimapuensis]
MVVAAPASGSGKTTVATGLMAALTARGWTVSGHKVGPDYIDPGYHSVATGRPPRNLDPVLVGEQRVPGLFAHGARGADVSVIEGVMGLFDGASQPREFDGPGDFASTAHVATLLSAPVLLVVDAARTSRSIAALVHGFRGFDPRVRLGGVVLNQVGSERHEELLRSALEDVGLPVLGAIRRRAELATPSRHLGLIPAAERETPARQAVADLAGVVAESCDLEAIVDLARSAPPVDDDAWDPVSELERVRPGAPADDAPVRVAVAGGAAFTFGYTEQVELLRAGGAEVVSVDPLRDEALPEEIDGLVIGGGFPEMHAEALSANEPMRRSVADAVGNGLPTSAECAGLLYLCRSLDDVPMCGVLDATATMTSGLTLGYRAAVAVGDSPVAVTGTRVHGHEFHRTTVTPAHGVRAAWQWDTHGPEGFTTRSLHASYLHVHWAGEPSLAARFLAASRRTR